MADVVRAHLGSIVPTPEEALQLIELAPALTLTLDPSHFIRQGISNERVLTLQHFHFWCLQSDRTQRGFSSRPLSIRGLSGSDATKLTF
jgi:hypothetical protein